MKKEIKKFFNYLYEKENWKNPENIEKNNFKKECLMFFTLDELESIWQKINSFRLEKQITLIMKVLFLQDKENFINLLDCVIEYLFREYNIFIRNEKGVEK